MKNIVILILVVFSLNAMASTYGLPYVKPISLDKKRKLSVEMLCGKDRDFCDYAMLRIEKERNEEVIAKVTKEPLAYCNVEKIIGHDSFRTDILVSFEPELDDGTNSCHVQVRKGRKVYNVELFIEVDM